MTRFFQFVCWLRGYHDWRPGNFDEDYGPTRPYHYTCATCGRIPTVEEAKREDELNESPQGK